MPNVINLRVNGTRYRVETDPDTPLLYALRNNLLLNGPKYGCGAERCGSCMVLLNGKANPSCRISCASASSVEITTLEGLGNAKLLHPLQKAFIEEQAAQCGYCMNGMIISAKALLDKNSSPSDLEIRQALEKVLCRCGSHTRIINAVKRAAASWKR
jgi:nicotinate dehydrogenase subunit A